MFYSLLIGLCLPIVLSLVYGTCVYFAYNKVTTQIKAYYIIIVTNTSSLFYLLY